MMKISNTDKNDTISRRGVLEGVALAAGVGASFMVATRATAQQKTPQSAAQYQAMPKGDQKCGTCMQFQPPNACKLVEGTISENGWCQLYTKKSG